MRPVVSCTLAWASQDLSRDLPTTYWALDIKNMKTKQNFQNIFGNWKGNKKNSNSNGQFSAAPNHIRKKASVAIFAWQKSFPSWMQTRTHFWINAMSWYLNADMKINSICQISLENKSALSDIFGIYLLLKKVSRSLDILALSGHEKRMLHPNSYTTFQNNVLLLFLAIVEKKCTCNLFNQFGTWRPRIADVLSKFKFIYHLSD